MSYCRFSSDNWKCDVYCYGASGGTFVTHVAKNKTVGEAPPLNWDFLKSPDNEESIEQFMEQHKAQMAWLETAERKPIGLEYDGDTFQDPDLHQFLVTLKMLKGAGYNVPQYVIDEVELEIVDEAKLKGGSDATV